MKKLLLVLTLSFGLALPLNAQIRWIDLGNTFAGFHAEEQPEEVKRMADYSPIFGAIALESNLIKNDFDKAKKENNPIINLLFHCIPGTEKIVPSQFNNKMISKLTPKLTGQLLIALEKGDASWQQFKDEHGKEWIDDTPGKITKKIDPLKQAYDNFCINENNKQRVRQYFAALLCLQGNTLKDIEDYLIGLGINSIKPKSIDLNITTQNSFEEYEKKIINKLSNDFFNSLIMVPNMRFLDTRLCMEETIATLITMILFNEKSKTLDLNYLSPTIQASLNTKFKEFIEQYSDLSLGYTPEKLNAIQLLFFNINGIDYLKHNDPINFEVDTTLKNCLALLNHFFGTQATSLENFGKIISTDLFNCTIMTEQNSIKVETLKNNNDLSAFFHFNENHAYFESKTNNYLSENEIKTMIALSKDVNAALSILSLYKDILITIFESSFRSGSIELIHYLLTHGVNIEGQNDNGETALFMARDFETVKLLIENGADVNIQDNTGVTALFYTYNFDITELLIEHGADVNIQDNTGQTALFKTNNFEIVEIAELLIKHGANVNIQDNDGQTALFMTNNFEIAELLIKHGTNVNIQNNNGQTALFMARNFETVKLLIEHGANVNIQDNTGITALFFQNDLDAAKLLIKHGGNVNIQDNNG